jgi:hypothetical protein
MPLRVSGEGRPPTATRTRWPPNTPSGRGACAALDMPFATFFDGVEAEAVAISVLITFATGEGRYRGCPSKAPMGSG